MSATGFKANPPSRSTSCSRPQYINNEPAAPPSSYTNSFAPSSFPAYPSPMIQTDSSAMQTPKPSRPPAYGRQASYGFPSTTSLPASPKSHALPHHSVLPAPGSCDDTESSAAFGDDAFAPLHQNQHQHQSSWGAFHQHQQKAAVADPWAAFGGATSSVSAASSAINIRQASDDDMDMDDDEDEDCVEQQMGGWRSASQPIFGHQQAVGGWDQRGRF